METKEIEVNLAHMTIIKHYLDSEQLRHEAYRVGWEGGNGVPRTPIAIRIGRSSETGVFYTGDLRPTRYVEVPHDEDFRLVSR